MPVSVLPDILTGVGSLVTASATWIGGFAGMVVSNPLLLLFISIPLVGMGIGLLKRLINLQ